MAHRAYSGYSEQRCDETQARWNYYFLNKAQ